MLNKYSPKFSTFLEIGCGKGYVLADVAKSFPEANIFGSEIFVQGLSFAKERVPGANLMQMDARNIPFANEFDVIGAFDVLEHIAEDELVIQQVYGALSPDGLFILSVPQHMWLWSPTDEQACHVRRYTNKDLKHKLERAGFKILRSTSFVSFLLPAMLLARLQKRKQNQGKVKIQVKTWV